MADKRLRRIPAVLATTPILIRDFPLELHRAMKAEAARRGVTVKTLYAEAARAFLAKEAAAARR